MTCYSQGRLQFYPRSLQAIHFLTSIRSSLSSAFVLKLASNWVSFYRDLFTLFVRISPWQHAQDQYTILTVAASPYPLFFSRLISLHRLIIIHRFRWSTMQY